MPNIRGEQLWLNNMANTVRQWMSLQETTIGSEEMHLLRCKCLPSVQLPKPTLQIQNIYTLHVQYKIQLKKKQNKKKKTTTP